MKLRMFLLLLCTVMQLMNACEVDSLHLSLVPPKNPPAIGIYFNQGCRREQQDRYHYEVIQRGDKKGIFIIVCDGHGRDGERVANFIVQELPRYFEHERGSIKEKMKQAFTALNTCDFIKNQFKSGTTASVAFIDYKQNDTDEIHCAHIGNSRIFLEKKGYIDWVTVDHDLHKIEERKRLERLGANVIQDHAGVYRIENYLTISRSFGDYCVNRYVKAEPEYMNIALTKDHRFLILATDGLWRVVTNQRVREIIGEQWKKFSQEAYLAQIIAKALGDEAIQKKSKDNITILVVDLLLLASVHKKKDQLASIG